MRMQNKVEFIELSGTEFTDAVTHYPEAKVWLKSPKLKYYQPWNDFLKSTPVERTVFLAVVPAARGEKSVVGMIELNDSPYSEQEVCLSRLLSCISLFQTGFCTISPGRFVYEHHGRKNTPTTTSRISKSVTQALTARA